MLFHIVTSTLHILIPSFVMLSFSFSHVLEALWEGFKVEILLHLKWLLHTDV